jgi:NO-binding membrane sensor protein with MHYT domain
MEFTYNPSLVALSIAVAILGSFTGLVMTTGIHRASGSSAALRILLGGLGIGGGIWSMHFISMLAVILPVELNYDVTQTVISAVIAIVFTAIALAIVAKNQLGDSSLPVSALFLGAGIVGMHYLGMYAIRGSCGIHYSWLGVFISVLIAIQASGVALWFTFRQRGVLDTLLGSVALGLAIALMHYSGMEATHFVRAPAPAEFPELLFSERYLALAVAITIYLVCGICMLLFSAITHWEDRHPQRGSFRRG